MTPQEAIKLRKGSPIWIPDISEQSVTKDEFYFLQMNSSGEIKIKPEVGELVSSNEVFTTESEAWNRIRQWHLSQIAIHEKALAVISDRLSRNAVIGILEGETCNRDGCDGVMERGDVENCSCHINPPCQACETKPLKCSKCGEGGHDEP